MNLCRSWISWKYICDFSSPMALHPHYSRQMNSFCTSKICVTWTLLFPSQLLCFWEILIFIHVVRLMFTCRSRVEKRTWSSSQFFGAYYFLNQKLVLLIMWMHIFILELIEHITRTLMANLSSSGAFHITVLQRFCLSSGLPTVTVYSALTTSKASSKVSLLSDDTYLWNWATVIVILQRNRASCALTVSTP